MGFMGDYSLFARVRSALAAGGFGDAGEVGHDPDTRGGAGIYWRSPDTPPLQSANLLFGLSDSRSVRCHPEHYAPEAKALGPVAPLFRQHGQGPEGLGPIRPDLRGSKEVLRRLAARPDRASREPSPSSAS